MFIISLEYTRPIAEVDRILPAHVEYLNKYYKEGVFLLSGRKVPRKGAIIMALADSKADLQRIIGEDPFCIEKVARYKIVEFHATKAATGLETLINK